MASTVAADPELAGAVGVELSELRARDGGTQARHPRAQVRDSETESRDRRDRGGDAAPDVDPPPAMSRSSAPRLIDCDDDDDDGGGAPNTDHDHDHDRPGQRPAVRVSAAPDPSRRVDSWFKPALRLENAGSVARDHLAAERTFLAYVRTSLAIASTGVALVQLLSLSTSNDFTPDVAQYSKALGTTLVGVALAVLALGTIRFFAIQKALLDGIFPAERIALLLLAFVLGSLVVVIFSVLLAATR